MIEDSLCCHCHPSPTTLKKAMTLLGKWVSNRVITLPEVYHLPSHEDQENLMYFRYHRKRGHTLKQCVPFRKIFDEEHRSEEVLFQERRPSSIYDLRFPSLEVVERERPIHLEVPSPPPPP